MTFDRYYREVYLPLHSHLGTRLCHYAGILATAAFIIWVLTAGCFILLLVAPLVVYPFAWTGHALFDKNRPAAWKNPIWAKRADLRMFWEAIKYGRI